MPAPDEPEAVPIRRSSRVEPEEGRPLDGDAIANGAFTRSQVPAVAQPILIAASGSRSRRRCAITAAPASPDRTWPRRRGPAARPRAVTAAGERHECARRQRDREQVPVHEAVDQERGREREPAAPSPQHVEERGDRGGADPKKHGVRGEETAPSCCHRPTRPPHEIHGEHRVLVALAARLQTRLDDAACSPRVARCPARERCPSSRACGPPPVRHAPVAHGPSSAPPRTSCRTCNPRRGGG